MAFIAAMKHTSYLLAALVAAAACDTVPEPPPQKDAATRRAPAAKADATSASPAATDNPTATAKPTATASATANPTATATGTAVTSAAPSPAADGEPDAKLLAPDKATEKAPATFKAKFHSTKGDFIIEAHRDWSPAGVDRFYNLVKIGFFKNVAAFRVVDGFVVQFGIHGNPKVSRAWQNASIKDEPVKEGNKRGRITFAKGGPDSRTTQLFINYGDNTKSLDGRGGGKDFPAIGEVVEGMKVIESFYKEYADEPTSHQGEITMEGNRWLKENYPKLDYLTGAEIMK